MNATNNPRDEPATGATDQARRPHHCGRPMLAVEDRNSSSPFYNQPIWWCAECHLKLPRQDPAKTEGRSGTDPQDETAPSEHIRRLAEHLKENLSPSARREVAREIALQAKNLPHCEQNRVGHTPGPWQQYGTVVFATGDQPAVICAISEPRPGLYVEHMRLELGSPNFEEAQANARLIVAAPELLAALKGLASYGYFGAYPALLPGDYEAAVRAINKAEGCEP